MQQVVEIYEAMVHGGHARAIVRFNLRKFLRSFNLPAVGISFQLIDDANFDFLQNVGKVLKRDNFWFRGGEDFPRVFLDNVIYGHERRTEFISICTHPLHHRVWNRYFSLYFAEAAKQFGPAFPSIPFNPPDRAFLRGHFKTGLMSDLIHFAAYPDRLDNVADLYLALFLLTFLEQAPGMTRDEVFGGFINAYPAYRADMTRITTTTALEERLDDMLHLMDQLTRD